jgi:hypothetical protein
VGGGRGVIGICVTVGLLAGGYVPVLWGASDFSLWSILFSALGGIAGLWLGVKLTDY